MLAARRSGARGVGAFETFVTQPEEVEADLVAPSEVVVGEGAEVFGFMAIVLTQKPS